MTLIDKRADTMPSPGTHKAVLAEFLAGKAATTEEIYSATGISPRTSYGLVNLGTRRNRVWFLDGNESLAENRLDRLRFEKGLPTTPVRAVLMHALEECAYERKQLISHIRSYYNRSDDNLSIIEIINDLESLIQEKHAIQVQLPYRRSFDSYPGYAIYTDGQEKESALMIIRRLEDSGMALTQKYLEKLPAKLVTEVINLKSPTS